MKIRYGSELKRLQQERNLLLWAFILLAILTLLLMWQYEVRIEQLEQLHHPQRSAPAREFDLLSPAQGTFSGFSLPARVITPPATLAGGGFSGGDA